MGYNKRQFQKTNDKKVLHKVRKHWVVVSLAMLMALGGGALATHASANADSTTANNGSNNGDLASRINQNMNQSKNTLVSASAQSNNNASASAQSANANNNTSAQSNGNQSANNQSVNNNQGSVNEQSIVKQASLLHQQILGNANQQRNLQVANQASQTTDQASNNNRQNNSGLGRVNTNAPKRMLGDDDSDNSTYTIRYIVNDNGNQDIVENDSYSRATGSPLSQDTIDGWTSALPQYKSAPTKLDTSVGTNGVTFDNSNNIPNNWESGEHDLNIYLTPDVLQKGQIIVQYNNVSDNNAAVSSKVYSDAPGQNYTNLANDKSMVPGGFALVPSDGNQGILSDGGLNMSNSAAIPFTSGVHTIKLAVAPNSTSSNAENVVYEDAKDDDVQVGGTQVTGKKGVPLNISQITSLTPTGYNLYTKNNQYGLTPSDGGSLAPTFKKGGTLAIEVEPNGVTPAKPSPEAGYSNAMIKYVDQSDGDQVIGTKQFQGKNSDTFEPSTQGLMTAPAGYIADTNSAYNQGLNDSYTYGSKPVDTLIVHKDHSYHAKNVNYNIEYEDVDNNNQQVGSVLQESGKEGTPINYTNYTTLLPANSTFVGLGTHDANVQANATNVVLVKVAKAPANINVQYVDKNTGSDVSNGTIKGSDVNYGSDINVDNYKDKNGNQQSLLPAGYTPISNQNTNVKVDSDAQSLDVLVTGNKVSDTTPKGSSTKNQAPSVKIVPIEQWYDQNGTLRHARMSSKQVSLNGAKYDSDTSVNLDDYKPASDAQGNQYIADSADNNGKIMVDKNGNAGGNDHTVKLYYDRVSPVNVTFVNNKTGKKVSSYQIKPSASDVNKIANNSSVKYDVTRGTDQTKPSDTAVPNGYNALPNQQNNVLVHALYPNDVNYMVEGKPVTVNYQVKRTTDGNFGAPQNLSPVNKTAHVQVGDTISMNATDSAYKPAGYNVDSADNTVNETVTPGASENVGQIANNGTSFKYDATGDIQSVTPIEIEYVNQSGNVVAHKAVKGVYGNQINVTDAADGGLSMPANYSLANSNEATTYEFNGDQLYQTSDSNNGDYPSTDTDHKGQLARVDVIGSALPNNEVNYDIVSNEMSDGTKTGSKGYNNISYNGANGQPARVGDVIKINANTYNPDTGSYSPTYSDSGAYFTVNADGSVTPSNPVSDGSKSLGLNYDIKQGYVTVTYKDNSGNTIGEPVTTNNDINKSFNMNSYMQNPPVVGGQHYIATGVSNPATKYTSAHQNPTINVQAWDTANIQYKDTKTGKIVGSASYSNNPANVPQVPSTYFTPNGQGVVNVPSGYKLDKNHPYSGSEALANVTYTVDVVDNHTHVPSKAPTNNSKYIPSSQMGTVTLYYVPSQYDGGSLSGNDWNDYKAHATNKIVTYGNGQNSDGFNPTPYENSLTSAGASNVNANSINQQYVTQYRKGQNQDFYVFYTPAANPNSVVTDNINYLDEDNNNKKITSLQISGTPGSKIDYSGFENVVPSGYTFDRLDGANSNLIGNATDDILVRKAVPNQTYGTINVTYKDQNGNQIGNVYSRYEKTGASFNASQAANNLPHGYEFVQIQGGITNAPSYYPGPDDSKSMVVEVKKAPAPYTTYNVRYMNGSTPVSQETVTGATGTLFNYSSYEDDIPSGYNYNGVSSSMPTTFTNNDTSGDSVAPAQNIDINVTPND